MPSALIVIDVQRSFQHRPFWRDDDVPAFLANLQSLVDRCKAAGVAIAQIFHQQGPDSADNPFSARSGLVRTLPDLRLDPDAVFIKNVHSALYGRIEGGGTLEQWLRDKAIDRVIVTGIRTEQCCETTARHASDLGMRVTYPIDATLTFPMVSRSGREFSPAEIKERTELVLAGRFAEVVQASDVSL
jgi:nicotinamidase-related amidase